MFGRGKQDLGKFYQVIALPDLQWQWQNLYEELDDIDQVISTIPPELFEVYLVRPVKVYCGNSMNDANSKRENTYYCQSEQRRGHGMFY